MKYRKRIIAVILAVFLLCMAGAYAGDVNDTAVTSQDSTSTDLIQIDENENISADGGELISGNDEGDQIF